MAGGAVAFGLRGVASCDQLNGLQARATTEATHTPRFDRHATVNCLDLNSREYCRYCGTVPYIS